MKILNLLTKVWRRASPNYRRDRARALQDKLDDFVSAQDLVYTQVTQELAAGHKTTHWIWYIFPQLSGMGTSAKSLQYGLNGWPEAKAYWDNYLSNWREKPRPSGRGGTARRPKVVLHFVIPHAIIE